MRVKVLTVLCHPRPDSFTAAVAAAFRAGLAESGHAGELADLYAEGFDPLVLPPDEPDWNDATKRYSDAVLAEQARIERHQAIAMVFPVWWWSFPAMLKGWIDRVWNRGWAYDESRLQLECGLLIGVASSGSKTYDGPRGYRAAMETQLVQGILDYCSVPRGRLELLMNSTDDDATRQALLARARMLGRAFGDADQAAVAK
jgi:NAD(P)H dehydrogenase (quinone)